MGLVCCPPEGWGVPWVNLVWSKAGPFFKVFGRFGLALGGWVVDLPVTPRLPVFCESMSRNLRDLCSSGPGGGFRL